MEDKFDGLELNHISRSVNEATNALAKAASGQKLVPTSVFASHQHKPSVDYEEPKQVGDRSLALGSGADQPSAPSDPKVMKLDEDPAIEPNPLIE